MPLPLHIHQSSRSTSNGGLFTMKRLFASPMIMVSKQTPKNTRKTGIGSGTNGVSKT